MANKRSKREEKGPPLTKYELLREKNIAAGNEFLTGLGFCQEVVPIVMVPKRKREEHVIPEKTRGG